MISYTVKGNHIGSAVSEILQYTQTHNLFSFMLVAAPLASIYVKALYMKDRGKWPKTIEKLKSTNKYLTVNDPGSFA